MAEPGPAIPASTAYPDDLVQSLGDRHNPPVAQATKAAGERTASVYEGKAGGDRPAEDFGSALSPIEGRDVLPGPDPEARGETHWHAALPVPIEVTSVPGLVLRTLADAGDFLSGRYATLEHSAALQETAHILIAAARLGTEEAVDTAGRRMAAYLAAMRLS